MQEEIFRFSVVRNPQRIPTEKLKTSVIHLIDEASEKYSFYTDFLGVKKKGEKREKYIEFATRKLTQKSFLKNLSDLKTDIADYSEWIFAQKKYDAGQFIEKAKSLFGDDLSKLVKSDDFKTDKYRISDSLIVATIVKPKQNGLRSELMNARRTVFLLEYLANEGTDNTDSKTIRTILKATILLPGALFPIPTNNKELRKKNEEALKIRKSKVEKSIKEINETTERIRINNEAIEELTKSYSSHLFEIKNAPREANNAKTSLSVIPVAKFNKLSPNTKNVILKDVGISNNMVDVPFVVKSIESENNRLYAKFNFDFAEELFDPADVAIEVEKTCGACAVLVIEDIKKENNFTGLTKGKVNQVFGQDLEMVRQKILKYEPGEIAHIENVLKGESKKKKHRKLHRSEETVFEESERSEEVENELETTDRFELQSETSKTISQDTSLEAGVTTTASYGAVNTVNIEAYGNYASNNASEESKNSASTYAKDVVSRSVQKIKERVLKRRSRTEINEVEIINKHKIENLTSDAENIAGIYRWVNKLYEAQVVNYGLRTMLEFMIPEPAAFYRFALSKNPDKEISIKKPDEPGFCQAGRFFPLKPTDLTGSNYMCFVGKYGVTDVEPPPPMFIIKSGTITQSFHPDSEIAKTGEKIEIITIPINYKAISAEYIIAAGRGHEKSGVTANKAANFGIRMTCGNNIVLSEQATTHHGKGQTIVGSTIIDTEKADYPFEGELSLDVPKLTNNKNEVQLNNEEGDFKIAITYASDIYIFGSLNVAITCERKDNALKQWQIDTFGAIMNTYNGLKLDYEEALQSQQFETEINIQGQNPFINREVEKTELKKHAISILTGQQYEGFNAMWQDHRQGFGYPEIDLEDAAKEGDFVQFFEQTLEWRHATYLFYDYFWGRKQNWIDMLNTKDIDSLFEKFLRAGYARVWIPIRPGFDKVIGHYICAGGEPWTEKDAPQIEGCEDGNYSPIITMIEEMKEQLDNDFVERPGTITVTNKSKVVTGELTDFSIDDVDREILINLESYRIAEFISPFEIRLREAYEGENDTIGVAMGVKYVGEPWVVQVPTSLVHLQSGSNLNPSG